jgi:quercetin dioxygenase-like cupin family protein
MTPQEIGALRQWTPEQMSQRVVRFADLDWSDAALLDSGLPGCGGSMAPAIGLGMSQERNHQAPVTNAHGFSIEWLRLPVGGSLSRHSLVDKQVLAVYQGEITIDIEGSDAPATIRAQGTPQGWDSYAMPANTWRSYRNTGHSPAVVLVMTAGDHRKNLIWDDAVVQAAGAHDRAIDANGYVAPKGFVDRSQR